MLPHESESKTFATAPKEEDPMITMNMHDLHRLTFRANEATNTHQRVLRDQLKRVQRGESRSIETADRESWRTASVNGA